MANITRKRPSHPVSLTVWLLIVVFLGALEFVCIDKIHEAAKRMICEDDRSFSYPDNRQPPRPKLPRHRRHIKRRF
jgi:hypothetical protein